MNELLDFLCGDKDYAIIRCQKFTRKELGEMFTKEATMRSDFENLIDSYWYAIECWKNKSTLFPNEFDEKEKYCKDLIKRYKIY